MSRKKTTVPEPPIVEGQLAESADEKQETLALQQLVPERKPTKRTTRQNLESVQRAVFMQHAEPMLHEAMEVIRIKARAGDKDALRLICEMNKLVGNKGISVTTNVQQNNQNEANARAQVLTSKGFDDLVRRLDGREHQITTDAEFVDIK